MPPKQATSKLVVACGRERCSNSLLFLKTVQVTVYFIGNLCMALSTLIGISALLDLVHLESLPEAHRVSFQSRI